VAADTVECIISIHTVLRTLHRLFVVFMSELETWVECAACSKWRRVVSLENRFQGEAADPWHCTDNTDPRFAACSAEQEKTDAEIDEVCCALWP
jgi:hypothetical protein